MKLADEKQRRRVLTDLDAILLVEAAAGTGKTSLIAGRVAMLLANGRPPQHIVAITFTELAASELSLRIRSYVAALLTGEIPKVLTLALPRRLTAEQRVNLVSAQHHLLRLARVPPHEQHPAVTEPDMGGLHDHRHAIEQDELMAPVKLIGFSRRKAQRDVGRTRGFSALLAPPSGVTAHGVVTAVIAASAQLFEDPDQRQLLASSLEAGFAQRQKTYTFRCR